MNVERLTHMITVLENVKQAKLPFDLSTWAGNDDGETHACNTSACACGYAGLDPVFQAQGLRLVITHDDSLAVDRPESVQDYNEIVASGRNRFLAEPVFKSCDEDLDGWDAIKVFFGIEQQTAFKLFSDDNYVGSAKPADVISRLKRLLKLNSESKFRATVDAELSK